MIYNSQNKRGYVVILVLVFAGVFFTIIGSLTGFIFAQQKLQLAKQNREKAVQIAEAGLDYYRWFLAHNPEDLQDGTGASGPYVHAYNDPEGGEIGSFSLEITGNETCSAIQAIEIESTGWSANDPTFKRTVFGKYARPSVAEYAYVINSNVWAGADRTIVGRYHSNGGIRMDGDNQSTVTSGVDDWLCTSSFGCSPSQTVDGVWGTGSTPSLWEFPVPQIDFQGLTVDLANMKTQAQSDGLYFSKVGGQSNRQGYRIVFLGDGTVDVYRVTNTSYVWSIHIDDIGGGWQRDYDSISNSTYLGNFAIPTACPLIFAEDKVWLEGTVNGKVTVAAAHLAGPNYEPDLIIEDNITYSTLDGSDGLTAIAEGSVRIPLETPDDLSIRGIFIAQTGYFGRNLYPCWYSPYDQRNSLTTHGTIVSTERVGTKWGYSGSGCGSNEWSGFDTRTNTYDRFLATDPPPLTPYVSEDYQFVEWREVE